jgi:hypothetical protein
MGKTMRLKTLLTATAVLAVAGINGCTSTYLIRGAGATTCATVVRNMNESGQYRHVYDAWLSGYLTRYNYEHDRKLGSGFDDRSLIDTALQYCGQNPLDNFDKAAEYIIQQLEAKS